MEIEASGVVVPTVNSVEPPPMSMTRNGGGSSVSPTVAPWNDRRPSSSPESS